MRCSRLHSLEGASNRRILPFQGGRDRLGVAGEGVRAFFAAVGTALVFGGGFAGAYRGGGGGGHISQVEVVVWLVGRAFGVVQWKGRGVGGVAEGSGVGDRVALGTEDRPAAAPVIVGGFIHADDIGVLGWRQCLCR